MSYLFNNDEKIDVNKRKILLAIYSVFIFTVFIFIIIKFIPIKNINLEDDQLKLFLKLLHILITIFCLFAYISCLIYYFCSKDDRHFFVSLIYLNNSIICFISLINNEVFYFLTSSIMRLFIMILVLKPIKLSKNRCYLTILILILTLILVKVDKYIFLNTTMFSEILPVIFIISISSFFIVTTAFAILAYKKCSYTYIFLIPSILTFSFRLIEACNLENIIGTHYSVSNLVLEMIYILICFIIIIIGMFIEIANLLRCKTILEKELRIFYNLVNLNSLDNIVFLDQNNKIFYANKNTFDNYKSNSYDNLNKRYTKFQNYNEEIIECSHHDNSVSYITYVMEMSTYFRVNIHKLNSSSTQYYYLVAFNDITKDFLLNLSSKKNEELLQNITDNIQDMIIGLNNDGVIEYANKSALKILNCCNNDFIGKNYFDFVANDSIDESLLSVTSIKHIYQVKTCQGRIIELESIVKDLENLEYSSVKKLIISKDLTDKNKLNDLTQKYDEIKAYEDSKNEFFANLSHELKTPLNIIYSTLQLFERMQNKDGEIFKNFYIKYKDALRLNCLRILRLVNNLIDITKADANSIDINFVNLNIIDFIENIISSIIPYANMKNLNVAFDTDNEDVFIKCDPDMIERILLNLLSNAIKFTPENKSIFVNIITDNDWVNIYVKDEGIGIDKNLQDLIFDRFVQIDKSLNRNTEGSGIGLSIVKSLVELHEGNVSIDSYVNKGTTFKVSLPNKSLSYTTISSKDNTIYNTDQHKIELELSDIYEIF